MSNPDQSKEAFPRPASNDGRTVHWSQTGMTLREWYAGQALSNPAICTGKDQDYNLRRWFGERGGVTSWEVAAAQAFEYADAMIGRATS